MRPLCAWVWRTELLKRWPSNGVQVPVNGVQVPITLMGVGYVGGDSFPSFLTFPFDVGPAGAGEELLRAPTPEWRSSCRWFVSL